MGKSRAGKFKYYKYFRISLFYFLLTFLVCKIKEREFQIVILYPIFKHTEKLNRFLKNFNLCKLKCALLKEWKNKKKNGFGTILQYLPHCHLESVSFHKLTGVLFKPISVTLSLEPMCLLFT